MQLVAKLPETSYARRKVTGLLVDELWDSLQHPPLSYIGDQYQYRQADGSHNVRPFAVIVNSRRAILISIARTSCTRN